MRETKVLENEYLAVFKSQNHAIYLYGILIKKGIQTKIIQTPCKISTSCTHSIRFSEEYMDTVKKEIIDSGIKIRGIYKITNYKGKKDYEKVY
ncbi:DUF3343 domain-containing protein [Clostridium neuense]|uniref:DUF3343 domain-containing protein n=1 Tax=Clostridium neuense TaxID=1728934 RepID=A0ABW8TL91_9CLOT